MTMCFISIKKLQFPHFSQTIHIFKLLRAEGPTYRERQIVDVFEIRSIGMISVQGLFRPKVRY